MIITIHKQMFHQLRERASLTTKLEAENAALKARVAELESKELAHEAELAVAHEHIADLQSQLAWTPVRDGLPTEPGTYEFSDGSLQNTCACELDARRVWSLELNGRGGQTLNPLRGWNNNYTHFRRIELPKEGET